MEVLVLWLFVLVRIYSTWKGSMAQLPLVLVYHDPLQVATFWEWRSPSISLRCSSHRINAWDIYLQIS